MITTINQMKPDEIKGKKFLVRVDFNVPIKNGRVENDFRIIKSLPTIEFLLSKGAEKIILINNAGVIEPLTHLIDSDPTQWGLAADINYKGVYHCMRATLPHMVNAGGGTIVNLSSGAANSALPGWSHYCSTKAAVKKLTEVAHRELHESNIRVVGLSPGTVATDMMKNIREAKINAVSHLDWSVHIPPEWAAEGVAFLCGPEGGECAGTDFSIKTPEGRARIGLPIEWP